MKSKWLGLVMYKLFTPNKMVNFFQINQVTHDQAVVLQSALQSIPNPSSECMLRNVSVRLAQQISDEVSFIKTSVTILTFLGPLILIAVSSFR